MTKTTADRTEVWYTEPWPRVPGPPNGCGIMFPGDGFQFLCTHHSPRYPGWHLATGLGGAVFKRRKYEDAKGGGDEHRQDDA